MNNSISLNELLNGLKAKNESTKLFIKAADKTVEIINKLVRARETFGITQNDLAKKCRMKRSELVKIETFKVIPKINTLIILAEAMGITIDIMS